MKTNYIKALSGLSLAAAVLLTGCASTEPVAEYTRTVEYDTGYSKDAPPVAEYSTTSAYRQEYIDPYNAGTTYRDRTTYLTP